MLKIKTSNSIITRMNQYSKLIGVFLFLLLTACTYDVEKQTTKMVKELNKAAPFPVDEYTRFDSASYSDKHFYYNYCLLNALKEAINPDELRETMLPHLKSFVNTNPSMKEIRKNKINVVYNYYDSVGKLITSITITP